MPPPCVFFEALDLLDLWHLYGHAKRVADFRSVSISKVSRRCWDMIGEMGVSIPVARGAPDPERLHTGAILMLRNAYQCWRLEQACLKVLPTFAASVVLRELSPDLDVLPDIYLSAEAIADHLRRRRIDLVVSSSLDLAGELIQQAQDDPDSPFVVVPLFEDAVQLAVNPAHPLAGLRAVASEDCLAFPSAGYPEGVARLAADALRARGLWRFPCKRRHFDPNEWLLGMRSPIGLCYETVFLSELMPESRELTVVPFADPLYQINCVVMLKEMAQQREVERALELIRSSMYRFLARSQHEFTRC